MRICGIKLTHDRAIALVEDGRLVFCVEQEKRGNNPRYQAIDNLYAVVVALAEHGLDPRDANHHEREFFPDGAAACQWGRVEHIWCEGGLWTKTVVSARSPAEPLLKRLS